MRTKIEQFCRALTRRMPSKKLSSRTRRRHRLAAAADILEERTLLATFTVTSALDTVNSNDGVTTLREAIDAANSTVGFDVIQFNINGGGPTTITLNSPLPGLHDNAITIDGRTQPGYSLLNGTPLIEINGQNLPVGQAGIWITGDQAGVYGLAINRVNGVGIFFSPGANNTIIAQNHIGTDRSGNVDLGNLFQGIFLRGDANRVENNLISGNDANGVWIDGNGGATGRLNVLIGNKIGTNVDGSAALGNGIHGIRVTDGATDNVIGTNGDGVDDFTEGNLISGNASSGIRLSDLGTNDNVIAGNFIGTTLDGSAALSNGFSGIWLRGGPQGTRIGTDGDGMADDLERNVISGNVSHGVFIQTTATETSIAGNFIGTAPSGTQAVANGQNGVRITNGSQHNTVGGPVTAMRNLISGNGEEGVFIANPDTSFNAVTGNFIGTDVTGLAALGNGSDGVFLPLGSSQNVVQTNVISANGRDGVRITNGSNHLIQGNFIGTGVDGEKPLPNTNGIVIARSPEIVIGTNSDGFADESEGNLIAANAFTGITLNGADSSGAIIAGNTIGTTLSGTALGNSLDGVRINTSGTRVGSNRDGVSDEWERNLIAFNGRNGVLVLEGGTNNLIRGNSIHSNSALGIDLGRDGVTANDAGDADTGPNDQQNFPVLDLAFSGASTRILGGLNSEANTTYTLEFFANSATDPSGFGEGERFLGNTSVTTNAFGNTSFDVTLSAEAKAGQFITATATDPAGNTSEFSAALAVDTVSATAATVTNTSDDGPGSLRQAIHFANANAGPDTIVFAIPTTDPGFVDVDSSLTGGDAARDAFVIQPLSDLPSLTDDGTTIDGRSQTTFGGETNPFGPEIVLDGSSAAGDGLHIESNNNEVYALNIQQFSGQGVQIVGGDRNIVAGNYIGTDATGRLDRGNDQNGVSITSSARFNVIGTDGDGTADAAERNVISGHVHGVWIADTGSDHNVVAGNFIGTDANGTAALGNWKGVAVAFGARSNIIGTDGDGLADVAERNLISGNELRGVQIHAIETDGNVIAGNYVGTDATGTAALGNGLAGVTVSGGAQSNRVGTDGNGTADADERNVISGNVQYGISIRDPGTEHNVVAGNYIGTDIHGMTALGNGRRGIQIHSGAQFNIIGTNGDGTGDSDEGNLISGNSLQGVRLNGDETDNNRVAGNVIGLDVTGSAALGNGRQGIIVDRGPQFNVLGTNGDGDSDADERNVIAGNALDQILIFDADDNRVAGNFVGIDDAGTSAVFVEENVAGIVVRQGSSRNLIGTDGDGVRDDVESNTIAFNGGAGVSVEDDGTTGNIIRGNSIHSNSGLGIDLDGDGVTPNDAGDTDNGPNDLQNSPTITLVESASATHVVGFLNSTPDATFVIDFYANSEMDPSGFGEGELYLGSTTVTTGLDGNRGFSAVLNPLVGESEFVTATATDENGNTSEFSSAVGVMNTPPTSSVEPLPLVAESLEIEIEVSGSDSIPEFSGNGIAEFDVFVSTDNGPFTLWMTLPGDDPVATFEAESSHLYAFRSVARDLAGNVESKPVAIETNTYVPDLEAPVSHVDDVDADTPMFTIDYSATDTGGSGLSTVQVVVEVDSGPAQIISNRNVTGDSFSGSTTYQALADGSMHTYRFYTTSTDGRGNAEAVPSDPDDVLVTADFTAPEELAVANFDVQRGASQRSFIRFLDVTFNTTVGLEDLLYEDRISLIRADLAGENSVDVSGLLSSATVEIVGQTLQIDFGAQGIGGNQNSNIGDGYYQLALDLDGDGDGELDEQLHFYRLFGDANGDRVVNTLDVFAVQSNYGAVGNNLDEDLNGDGVVNILDRVFAQQSLGRMLDGDLSLDD